jgi:folylpolyglutamate synthase/dihydropteroate synthase
MVTKYGIWAMMKNKEPDIFIKQFKNTFKKIITIPIENEQSSLSARDLYKIAIKNNFNAAMAKNFLDALKKVSSSEKKLIVCFGSLYNIGNILNKN